MEIVNVKMFAKKKALQVQDISRLENIAVQQGRVIALHVKK